MWHYVHLGISKDKAAFEETDTVPLEYKLDIIPDFSTATFAGSVTIKIRLNSKEPAKAIELDSHQLAIHNVQISTSDKKPKTIKSTFALDSKSDKLIIKPKESLTHKSFYDVQINYTGRMYRYNPFGLAIYQSNNAK